MFVVALQVTTLDPYRQEHALDFSRRADASEEGNERHDDPADQKNVNCAGQQVIPHELAYPGHFVDQGPHGQTRYDDPADLERKL